MMIMKNQLNRLFISLNYCLLRVLYDLVKQQGISIIPFSIYFSGSKIKVNVAICKGKKLYDKRASIKKRDAERNIKRTIKQNYI